MPFQNNLVLTRVLWYKKTHTKKLCLETIKVFFFSFCFKKNEKKNNEEKEMQKRKKIAKKKLLLNINATF